jgi:integrase
MGMKKEYEITKNKLKVWEHPKNSGIKIRERIHPSLTVSYRISVPTSLNKGSKPEILQCPTLEKAFALAQNKHSIYLRLGRKGANLNADAMCRAADALNMLENRDVTLDQAVREHCRALDQIGDRPTSLKEVVRIGLETLFPVGGLKTLNEVVEDLIRVKLKSQLRERSLMDFKSRAGRICRDLGSELVRDLSKDRLFEWLTTLDLSFRSQVNYRNVLGEILRHAVGRKWLLKSPMDELTKHENNAIRGMEVDSSEPGVLSPEEATCLIQTAWRYDLEPYGKDGRRYNLLAPIALGLFAGIRTEELKGLTWDAVRLEGDEPYVEISARIAKKRRIRHVQLPPHAVEWLYLHQDRIGPITESLHANDYQKRFRKLLLLAGFKKKTKDGRWTTDWKVNAMRHSFASAHYALYGTPLETARLLGHKGGDDVLFSHYRALCDKKTAERYFEIKPTSKAIYQPQK